MQEVIQREKLGAVTVSILLVAVTFILCTTHADLFWLMVAAIPCAWYGYRKDDKQLVKISCLTPLVYSFGFLAAKWLLSFNHRRIDADLLAMDGGISTAVWHWCNLHPATLYVLNPVYYAMGFWILVTLATTNHRRELLRSLVFMSFLVTPIYWLFPAVGPRWIGTSETFTNAMPSMHLGFALACWYWAAPKMRGLSLAFVLLTVCATLGLGEHYVIDLVVAVPFTLLICKAVGRVRRPDVLTARRRIPLPSALVSRDQEIQQQS